MKIVEFRKKKNDTKTKIVTRKEKKTFYLITSYNLRRHIFNY